jgi:two-component system phosphate regulon sensor histidine kinase PhoR
MEKKASYIFDQQQISDVPQLQLAQKLSAFMENNYQRIETLRKEDFTILYFVLKSQSLQTLCAITIHTTTFIDQNLKPGIQQIAQNGFNISIVDTVSDVTSLPPESAINNLSNVKSSKLWYLPGFRLNIRLQSATIDELVLSRSRNDRYLLWGLILIVLLGATFVIVNIRKAIRLAEIKSEFVSNVSHEIRTPIALISMYAETLLLKRVKNEEKANEYLNVIFRETNRLASMVNRILSFSKMEENKRIYQFDYIDLQALILEVVENFKPHFENNMVDCSLHLNETSSLLWCDKEALTESLINLIENAIKYGKGDAKLLKISTIETKDSITIEVEDNGIGIASKHLNHIFDKFYRVSQGDIAHQAKGTGLGLNIVHQIMRRHNGEITVLSTEGVGSCFCLKFPLKHKNND